MKPLLLSGWDFLKKVEALLVTGFLYEVTAELHQLPLVRPAKESESDKVNVQKGSNLLA